MKKAVEQLNHLIVSCQLKLDDNPLTNITKSLVDQLNNILNFYFDLSDDLFTDKLFFRNRYKKLLFKIEEVAIFFWNQWWKTDEQYELNYLKNVRQFNGKIFHYLKLCRKIHGGQIIVTNIIEEVFLQFEPIWINILKYIESNNISSSKLSDSPYLTELSLWFDQFIDVINDHRNLWFISHLLPSSSILDCLHSPFYKKCLLSSEIYCHSIDKFYIGICASYFVKSHFSNEEWLTKLGPLMSINRLYVINHSKHIDQWSDDILYCMEKILVFLIKDFDEMFPSCERNYSKLNQIELYLPNHDEYLEALIKILMYEKEIVSLSIGEQKLILLIIKYIKLACIRPIDGHMLELLRSKNLIDICLSYIDLSYDSIRIEVLTLIAILANETALERLNIADTLTRSYFDILEKPSQLHEQSYNVLEYLMTFSILFHHKSIQEYIGRLNKVYYLILLLAEHPRSMFNILWTLSFSPFIRKQLYGQIQFLREYKTFGEYSIGLFWTLGDRCQVKQVREIDYELENFVIQQDIILDSSSYDYDLAKQIYFTLIASGYRVWFPQKDKILEKHELIDLLKMEITACDSIRILVVCLSDDYEQDNICRTVLHYALDKQLKIIPIIIQKYYQMQDYLQHIFNQTEIINFLQLTFDNASDLLSKVISNVNDYSIRLNENSLNINTVCDLYQACQNNDFIQVKQCLLQMTVEQINEIQSNGNTALHIAVTNNNKAIVRLLLNKGALRSIRDNQHKITAYEAICTDEIKYLFKRFNTSRRFLTDLSYQLSEWTIDFKTLSDDPLISNLDYCEILNEIKNFSFSSDELSSTEKQIISWFLNRAIHDSTYILRGFTSVTNFSMIFNRYLLKNTNKMVYLLRYNSSFEPFIYLGETYRGIIISRNDAMKYNVGSKIIVQTLLSTTKDCLCAELMVRDGQDDYVRRTSNLNFDYFASIFIYRIKHRRTAYDIQTISEVPDEQEVLILPCSVFIIKTIKQYDETARDGIIYQFELEDCNQFDEDKTIDFIKEM